MANLWNYKFSRNGDFICKTKTIAAANFKKISLGCISTRRKSVLVSIRYRSRGNEKSLCIVKPNKTLKYTSMGLRKCLWRNCSTLDEGHQQFHCQKKFLNNIKNAFVTSLLKKEYLANTENYRHILVPSSLSIVFDRLRQNQIVEFLHNERCFRKRDFGYRTDLFNNWFFFVLHRIVSTGYW